MRSGLLLISFGLLGFFTHSICAKPTTADAASKEIFSEERQKMVEQDLRDEDDTCETEPPTSATYGTGYVDENGQWRDRFDEVIDEDGVHLRIPNGSEDDHGKGNTDKSGRAANGRNLNSQGIVFPHMTQWRERNPDVKKTNSTATANDQNLEANPIVFPDDK